MIPDRTNLLLSLFLSFIVGVIIYEKVDLSNPETVFDKRSKSAYGYYTAFWKFNDPELINGNYQYKSDADRFSTVSTLDGKKIFAEPYTICLLLSPFFLSANVIAPLLNEYPNGYSFSFLFFILSAVVFYTFYSFNQLLTILRKSGRKTGVSAVLILFLLLTVTVYTVYETSVIFDFFLMTLFVSLQNIKRFNSLTFFLQGIVLGLLFLMSSYYLLLFPIVLISYFLYAGIQKWRPAIMHIISLCAGIFVAWLPQLYYWNKVMYRVTLPDLHEYPDVLYSATVIPMVYYLVVLVMLFVAFFVIYKKRKQVPGVLWFLILPLGQLLWAFFILTTHTYTYRNSVFSLLVSGVCLFTVQKYSEHTKIAIPAPNHEPV